MSDVLIRIKRAVLAGRVNFTLKARLELEADGLDRADAVEAIIEAPVIYKTLRSRSELRGESREKLYVIIGVTYDGIPIYTKGKLVTSHGKETFYVLVSSKRSTGFN